MQEDVEYAASQGATVYRTPTRETASKIQKYTELSRKAGIESAKVRLEIVKNPKAYVKKHKIIPGKSDAHYDNTMSEYNANPEGYVEKLKAIITQKEKELVNKGDAFFPGEQETVLRKYDKAPKEIKKIFGVEPKVVTDPKGNTWYEMGIPKSYREGRAEIKALSLTPFGLMGVDSDTTNYPNPYGLHKTGQKVLSEINQ